MSRDFGRLATIFASNRPEKWSLTVRSDDDDQARSLSWSFAAFQEHLIPGAVFGELIQRQPAVFNRRDLENGQMVRSGETIQPW
jgi:hypothetical protein